MCEGVFVCVWVCVWGGVCVCVCVCVCEKERELIQMGEVVGVWLRRAKIPAKLRAQGQRGRAPKFTQ